MNVGDTYVFVPAPMDRHTVHVPPNSIVEVRGLQYPLGSTEPAYAFVKMVEPAGPSPMGLVHVTSLKPVPRGDAA